MILLCLLVLPRIRAPRDVQDVIVMTCVRPVKHKWCKFSVVTRCSPNLDLLSVSYSKKLSVWAEFDIIDFFIKVEVVEDDLSRVVDKHSSAI